MLEGNNTSQQPVELNLSTEMIAFQKNDWVVPALVTEFSKLQEGMKDNRIVGESVFKNKITRNIILNIDRIVFDRFKIKIKHLYSAGVGYAVLSAPPKNYNVLISDHEKSYKNTKRWLSQFDKDDFKDYKDVKSFDKDMQVVLKNWIDNVDKLDKQLDKDGVLIDYDKAVVHNLPDDYSVDLLADFDQLINTVDLTSEEIVAGLLHEIGHIFTHLESAFRSVRNTSVLFKTIKEEVEVNNNSLKKSINLTYRRLYNNNDDVNEGNTVTATIRLVDTYIKSTYVMGDNTYMETDSEQQADQFAARFGMNKHLVTSLDKLHKYGLELSKTATIALTTTVFAYYSLISLIAYGSITVGILSGGVTILTFIIIAFIVDLLENLLTSGKMVYGTTYDYDKRRYKRIRNDLVRSIRTAKLPKDVIKAKIKEIEFLDNIIATAKDEKETVSLATSLMRKLLPGAKALVDTRELDMLTEDLMENNLHIASKKLSV